MGSILVRLHLLLSGSYERKVGRFRLGYSTNSTHDLLVLQRDCGSKHQHVLCRGDTSGVV